MFSRKLGYALGAIIVFLTTVAFVIGRPEHRDSRIYPIVREYEPFKVENGLGGLKILRRDNPEFKEEPDTKNFYPRLKELERQWAQKHLRLEGDTLKIVNDKGELLKAIPLKNEKEKRFVIDYYGVKAQ